MTRRRREVSAVASLPHRNLAKLARLVISVSAVSVTSTSCGPLTVPLAQGPSICEALRSVHSARSELMAAWSAAPTRRSEDMVGAANRAGDDALRADVELMALKPDPAQADLRHAIAAAVGAAIRGNQVFVFREPPYWPDIDANGQAAVDELDGAVRAADRLGIGGTGLAPGPCAGLKLDSMGAHTQGVEDNA